MKVNIKESHPTYGIQIYNYRLQ